MWGEWVYVSGNYQVNAPVVFFWGGVGFPFIVVVSFSQDNHYERKYTGFGPGGLASFLE